MTPVFLRQNAYVANEIFDKAGPEPRNSLRVLSGPHPPGGARWMADRRPLTARWVSAPTADSCFRSARSGVPGPCTGGQAASGTRSGVAAHSVGGTATRCWVTVCCCTSRKGRRIRQVTPYEKQRTVTQRRVAVPPGQAYPAWRVACHRLPAAAGRCCGRHANGKLANERPSACGPRCIHRGLNEPPAARWVFLIYRPPSL
jgi:hypothetical protein